MQVADVVGTQFILEFTGYLQVLPSVQVMPKTLQA